MYSINFFSQLVALGWGVALAQGLAGLTPGPALVTRSSTLKPVASPLLLLSTTLPGVTLQYIVDWVSDANSDFWCH